MNSAFVTVQTPCHLGYRYIVDTKGSAHNWGLFIAASSEPPEKSIHLAKYLCTWEAVSWDGPTSENPAIPQRTAPSNDEGTDRLYSSRETEYC